MPWEKSFDLDDAVDCAIEVFWAKGFEATSMADLVDRMGIHKGSLYNAFGSKKELFKRALLKYDQDNRQTTLATLEGVDDAVAAISKLFDAVIAQSTDGSREKGCLLVNTALEHPNHDLDVREIVDTALGDFEAFFKRRIKRGQLRGVIPKSINANQTAKSLLALVVGLRVLSRGSFGASQLRAIKNGALRLLTETVEPTPKS